MIAEVYGFDEVLAKLDRLSDIPESLIDKMLNAGADILVRAQQEEIRKMGLIDKGILVQSIRKTGMKYKRGARVIYVYPQGTRQNGKNGTRTNAMVGFVTEYGSPHRGIAATNWMNHANDRVADQVAKETERIFDDYYKDKVK
jgi:hypothetical protein